MAQLELLVVLVALLSLVNAASLYDNPDQDPISPDTTPLEELERKWGLEVLPRIGIVTSNHKH